LTLGDSIFSPDGKLAQTMADYEIRPQQEAMADAVGRTLARGGTLMVEAGTGVGKTFAYLAPLLFGDRDMGGARTVVSTGTIALQEQLVCKDIPFLQDLLETPRPFALLKGRSNYICLRRLDLAGALQQELFDVDEERRELQRIAFETDSGAATLQDLTVNPPRSVWAAVRAEEGNCGGTTCRLRARCPFRKARAAAAAADLVVVNHALLTADMALKAEGSAILPEYEILIVDEAHRLENVAASNLGIDLRAGGLLGYMRTLAPGKKGGWLRSLGASRAANDVRRAFPTVFAFFEELRRFMAGVGDRTYRITMPYFVPDTLSPVLFDLGASAKDAARRAGTDEARTELHAIEDRLNNHGRALRAVLDMSAPGHVFWAEVDGTEFRNPSLRSSPVEVSSVLREKLFGPPRSTVLTSATLSVPGAAPFDYFRSRLGLDAGDELILGSPFDYKHHVSLVAHQSMPPPSNEEDYLDALGPAIMKHLARNEGGAFVLFTSYKALNRVYEQCAADFEMMGYTVLRQGGDQGVRAMLETFRSSQSAVILGADSFWEGVDVPGKALTLVILTRFPFASPGHPLAAARIEALDAQGRNPFKELTLPEAILRFKQGFGRLIRRKDDAGTVAILDSRIATRWYGRLFYQALPECDASVE